MFLYTNNKSSESEIKKTIPLGTFLVAQWLRIRLPMRGTRVRSLVQEDPTCCRAAGPVRHNYWACALEPASHDYWARMPQLLKPACPSPCSATREATAMRSPHTAMKSSPRSPQLEKAHVQQQRPNIAKNKIKIKNKNQKKIPLTIATKRIKYLGINFFQFYWKIIDIHFCISLRYTAWWFDLHICETMTTIGLINVYYLK